MTVAYITGTGTVCRSTTVSRHAHVQAMRSTYTLCLQGRSVSLPHTAEQSYGEFRVRHIAASRVTLSLATALWSQAVDVISSCVWQDTIGLWCRVVTLAL